MGFEFVGKIKSSLGLESKKVNGSFEGGATPQTAEEITKNWTPKEQAAFEALNTLPNYAKLLQNPKNLEIVKKFAEDPTSVIKTAKYDKAENKFITEQGFRVG